MGFNSYDLAEVKKHNTAKDAWIVIDGYVHDVTEFLRSHPGGAEIMLEHLGTDATEIFTSDSIHQHSKAAHMMLDPYRIGVLRDKKVETKFTKKYNIDVEKPMLWQVGNLGSDYFEWVHLPIHPRSGGIRIFHSDFLEFFTRTPWWLIPLVWVPFSSFAAYKAFSVASSPLAPALLIPFFCLCWYLLEYIIHRWLFHMYAGSYKANIIHFLLHGIHHLTPMDKDRLVFPPALGLAIAGLLYSLFKVTLPDVVTFSIAAGLIAGYVSYDMTHYFIHHAVPGMEHFRVMKTFHLDHHYKDPDTGFGITSKVFDVIFGTLPAPVAADKAK